PAPNGMPLPLVLRTDGQIRDNRKARFGLSTGQPKVVPILFVGPVRKDEWFAFDERAEKYPIPAGPAKLLLGVYGGKMDGKALIKIEVGTDWRVYPSIESVPMNYKLANDDQ